MSVAYQLRIYSAAGVLRKVVVDFLALAYKRQVNAPGSLAFTLPASHDAIDYLELDAQVEVWRADHSIAMDWYCEFRTFWRGGERRSDESGISTYAAICVGQMDLLRRSAVGYAANTANRNTFSSAAAETIVKALVTYNATSTGTTADGRVRTVTTSGITVQSDSAGGNVIDYSCAWQNLLAAMQEVALIGGGDYDLVKTGARAWQFRWYTGQLGTDRSGTITFALQYGNMATPQLTVDHTGESTIAIVGGQGEESARTIVVRTGTNYHATDNAVEVFVDARQLTTTASLNARGDSALEHVRQRNKLTFRVLQVPSTRYGRHYFLGDLVTGYYEGITTVQKVAAVSVNLNESGQESIIVELADV